MAIGTNNIDPVVKRIVEDLVSQVESSTKRTAAEALGPNEGVNSSSKRAKEEEAVSLRINNLIEKIKIEGVDANVDTLQTLTLKEAKHLLLEDARCNNSEILCELFEKLREEDINFFQNGLSSALECHQTVKSLLETDRKLLDCFCHEFAANRSYPEIFKTCLKVLKDEKFPENKKKSLLVHHDPLQCGVHIALFHEDLELLTMITPLLQNLSPEAIAKLCEGLDEVAGDTFAKIASLANEEIPGGSEIYRIMTRGLTEISKEPMLYLTFDLELDEIIKADQNTQSDGFHKLLLKSLEYNETFSLKKISHKYKALASYWSNKMKTKEGFLTDFSQARVEKEDKYVLAYLLEHGFVKEKEDQERCEVHLTPFHKLFFECKKFNDDARALKFSEVVEECMAVFSHLETSDNEEDNREYYKNKIQEGIKLLAKSSEITDASESIFSMQNPALQTLGSLRLLCLMYLGSPDLGSDAENVLKHLVTKLNSNIDDAHVNRLANGLMRTLDQQKKILTK